MSEVKRTGHVTICSDVTLLRCTCVWHWWRLLQSLHTIEDCWTLQEPSLSDVWANLETFRASASVCMKEPLSGPQVPHLLSRHLPSASRRSRRISLSFQLSLRQKDKYKIKCSVRVFWLLVSVDVWLLELNQAFLWILCCSILACKLNFKVAMKQKSHQIVRSADYRTNVGCDLIQSVSCRLDGGGSECELAANCKKEAGLNRTWEDWLHWNIQSWQFH